MKEIGWGAFSYSDSINSIIMSNSVDRIDDFAFEGTSIKSIELPSNVIEIGELIFYECFSLEEIHCKIVDLKKLNIKESCGLSPQRSCKLFVPAGTRWAYKHHPVFGKFANIEVE